MPCALRWMIIETKEAVLSNWAIELKCNNVLYSTTCQVVHCTFLQQLLDDVHVSVEIS